MEGLMRDHREYERKPKVRPARRAGLGWAEGPHNVETLDRSMTTPISATLAITSHQGPLRKQVTRALAWCLERGEAAAGGGGGGGGGAEGCVVSSDCIEESRSRFATKPGWTNRTTTLV